MGRPKWWRGLINEAAEPAAAHGDSFEKSEESQLGKP